MKQIKFEVKLENGQFVEVDYDEKNIRVTSKSTNKINKISYGYNSRRRPDMPI